MLTEQQRKERRTGIGGSDVAAILGISPFATAFDVYQSKVGPEDQGFEENEAMRWGNLLEALVANEWAVRNKRVIKIPVNEGGAVFRDTEHHCLFANPDYEVVGENAGLEIKTTSEYKADEWGEEGTDQIPDYYLTQVLHYIGVMGWDRCFVAVLIGGNKLRSYVVERDGAFIANIRDAAVDFWNKHVAAGVPPARSLDQVKSAYPSEKPDTTVEATTAVAEDVQRITLGKQAIKETDTTVKEAMARVQEFMGDAERLVFNGKTIATWKSNKPSQRLDTTALVEKHPDLCKEFTVEAPGARVFLTKKF